jgi:small GTP-binding protein
VAKAASINKSLKALVFSGKADLDAVKQKVSSLNSADYTQDTWANVMTGLRMAEESNSTVQIKAIAINIAINGLEFIGKSDLEAAKAETVNLVRDEYSDESWRALEAALRLPEKTNADTVAKAKAVIGAIGALEDAFNPALDAAKQASEGLNANNYTPESWEGFQAALSLPEDSKEQAARKADALNLALENLVFAGQAVLDKLKDKADELDLVDYTRASRQALMTAFDMPESSNPEVMIKTKALKKAIASLEYGKLIVIQGRPNVGKSSLLNAISETDEAIVTDIPGTTRDILRQTVEIDGYTVTLLDTAGIRETYNQIEKIGVERAYKAARSADMVLLVIDGSVELQKEDVGLLEGLRSDSLILLNKSDLGLVTPKEKFGIYAPPERIVEVSAVSGDGLIDLYLLIGKMFRAQAEAAGSTLKTSSKSMKPKPWSA